MITLIYMIFSFLNGNYLVRLIISFPAVYILPGLLMILATNTGKESDVKKLVVKGFFVSLLINVILTSILVFLNFNSSNVFLFIYTLLMLTLIAINWLRSRNQNILFSRQDSAIFLLIAIGFIALVLSFSTCSRIFTLDESSYIADARDIVLKDQIASWSSSFSSDIITLLNGRTFWLMFQASFCYVCGVPSYQLNLVSCLFLPMMSVVSCLLIPSNLRDKGMLQFFVVILSLTSPLLVQFSGYALSDLAVAFFTLLSIFFFVSSLRDNLEKPSIDLIYLSYFILSLIVIILIKPNILFLFPCYAVLLLFIFRKRLFKLRRQKIFVSLLILPPLIYEFIIEIPYIIVVWLNLGNTPIGSIIFSFAKQYIAFGSPLEIVIRCVVPARWNPTTIFSHDYVGVSSYLYKMFSPEALGLLFAAIALIAPLLLCFKHFLIKGHFKILVGILYISALLYLAISLPSSNISDINRYSLFIVPIIIVVSVLFLYEGFNQSNPKWLIFTILPCIFLLQLNSLLSVMNNGVLIGYGITAINWTGLLLFTQLVLYIVLVLLIAKGSIVLKIMKVMAKIDLKVLLYSILILSIIIYNIFFAVTFVKDSTHFKNDEFLNESVNVFSSSNNSFIFSNSFLHLRNFVADEVYADNHLFALPLTKSELNALIARGFNGSKIVITDNPLVTGHAYADSYALKLQDDDYIIPVYNYPHDILMEAMNFDPNCVLDVSPKPHYSGAGINYVNGINLNNTVHNTFLINDSLNRTAWSFNGKDSYVQIENTESLSVTSTLSVRVWFSTTSNQSGQFIMEKDSPYSYGIYLTKNSTSISFYLRLKEHGVVTVETENRNYSDGLLHDTVGTFDGRYLQLYVDGQLEATKDIGGNDTVVTSSQPLWIGTWSMNKFFSGQIYRLQIFNKTLTFPDIQSPYLKDNSYAQAIYKKTGESRVVIYEIEGSVKLQRKYDSDILVQTTVNTNDYLLPTLKFDIESSRSANLTLIIGTYYFSKIESLNVACGENKLELPFEYKLPDGRSYGALLSQRCDVVIIDEFGNIIYESTLYGSKITDNLLLTFIAILAAITISFLTVARLRFKLGV